MNKELLDHIAEINAKAKEAWEAESPKGGYRMRPLYTEETIEARVRYYGIKTPADWDALMAWLEYYDLHKDVEGISPRWTKWSERTAEEWNEEIEILDQALGTSI